MSETSSTYEPFVPAQSKVREARDVKFFPVLDNRTCNLKGSYTVEVKAQIDQDQWTIQRFKRYDLIGLMEGFGHEGWSLVSTHPFYDTKSLVVLFQKD